MDINALAKAVSEYGITLIVALLALAALVYLFKLYAKSWEDRIAFVEARRAEERIARLESESRLASNNVALREATAAFLAQQRLMETFMELERQRDKPARRT